MKLSIVSTLYRSAPYIEEFHRRITAAAHGLTDDLEIILVNDGSPDDSLTRAVALSERDPRVTVVDLSRNFGHHKAMMTGLAYCHGDLVFLIDIDLEEQPEWLAPFHQQLLAEACDVVYGVQEQRRGGVIERVAGGWFYILASFLTNLDLPRNIVTARLMSRRYVEALLSFEEREFFIAGLWQLTGFEQRPQVVRKLAGSETTYTLRHKLSILVNSVTSFSATPLVMTFYLGIGISAGAGLYTVYLVFNWLLQVSPMPGWTSVMASVWLLGGLVIAQIGLVGIYLAKVFSETKRRPYTIVRRIYGVRE